MGIRNVRGRDSVSGMSEEVTVSLVEVEGPLSDISGHCICYVSNV